ncbi:MAG: metallophosphoesterase [Sedimentisphaerales bacterium]
MNKWIITRREFLKSSALAGISAVALTGCQQVARTKTNLRFGIVTDSHYADADMRDNRYYRESTDKMLECVDLMNEQKVDFLIELGDFKDQDEPAVEERTISHLRTIEQTFQKFDGTTYHVLGNHDMDSISKEQFLENITNTKISAKSTWYSFDNKGIHFIVLDANFLSDGTPYDHGNFVWNETYIPQAQLSWLTDDLAATRLPSITFCHQQLGGRGGTYVRNSQEVRNIFEQSGKVLAAFNGHEHNGGYASIEGIHYYTLKAVVDGSGSENSAYAIVEVLPDNNIIITGYRKAIGKDFSQT